MEVILVWWCWMYLKLLHYNMLRLKLVHQFKMSITISCEFLENTQNSNKL